MKIEKRFKEPKRFWSKVDVGEVDECWNWLASKRNEYGCFGIRYRTWYAHRVAWILTYGPIPEGLCVLHHCDNRACCNPYHLFLGTRADNAADASRKGQKAKKLTKEEVLEIRDLYSTGELTQRELADKFDIDRSAVSDITRRKWWKWLE
jgi:hypothetical protein